MTRRSTTGLAVLALILAAGGGLVSAFAAGQLIAVVVLASFFVPLVVLRSRLQVFFLSPSKLALAVFATVGVVGFLVFGQGQRWSSSLIEITPELGGLGLRLFAVTIASLFSGVLITSWLVPSANRRQGVGPLVFSDQVRSWLLPAAALPGVMLLVAGPGDLLRRTEYLRGEAGSVLVGAAGALAMAGIGLLGYVVATERGSRRLLAIAMSVGYWAALLSLGSRQFALAPIVFAIAAYTATFSRAALRRVVFAVVLSVLLLPIPLYLRGQASHGLIPYLADLAAYPIANSFNLGDSASNLLFGFPVSTVTAFDRPPLPGGAILTSLNPAPGGLSGFYKISNQMRINFAVPYSGVGEVGNVGWALVVAFWALAGALLATLDRAVGRFLEAGNRLMALAVVGCSAIATILVTSYNLRSASRYVWYAVALVAVAAVLARWGSSHRGARGPTSESAVLRRTRPPSTTLMGTTPSPAAPLSALPHWRA